ncbi:MAG: SWIM zinc finger family protein, partial [Aestuariivirgaceae bacterium]
MALTLQTVEAMAPDQSSLTAASKLLKPAKWPLRGRDAATGLIWGECQGSGANPYRVMADVGDQGYKCTCPSRKFPCKHSLALLWMFADSEADFTPGAVPDWVSDWVGRRRKTGGAAAAVKSDGPAKSLADAQKAEPEAPPDPKKEARRQAAAEKRAQDTARSVSAGLDELDQCIADQLRLGLAGFLGDVTERCRRIAARLVDAKAASLASRIDEMPARVLALRAEE